MYRKVLFVLAIVFLLLNVVTLKDGHNWGGDFAQYIRHGQNIAEGLPYASRIQLDQRVISPPGFPLILAPFLKIFGLNFIVLKSLNVVFWFFFVFFAYRLMKKELSPDFVFLGTLVLISSPAFFTFKQNVLTDIPFLTFVTAGIYFFTRFDQENRERKGGQPFLYAALVCMAYAFLIRWAGFLLFAAAVPYVLFSRDLPKRKVFAGLGAAFLVSLWIQWRFGVSAVYHAQELHVPLSVYLPIFFKQPSVVLNQILEFFFPRLTLPVVPFVQFLKWILTFTGPVILIAVYWHAVKDRRNLSFLRWFFTLYLTALVVWVLFSGWRYVLPAVLPVMIIVIKDYSVLIDRFRPRTRKVLESILKGFLVLIIFNSVVTIIQEFGFNDDMIYVSPTKEMTEWIKNSTDEKDHFMFSKPRVVGLLTGRVGEAYYNKEEQKDVCGRIDRFDISYVITTSLIINKIHKDFDVCPYTYKKVWSNEVYQIYNVLPN